MTTKCKIQPNTQPEYLFLFTPFYLIIPVQHKSPIIQNVKYQLQLLTVLWQLRSLTKRVHTTWANLHLPIESRQPHLSIFIDVDFGVPYVLGIRNVFFSDVSRTRYNHTILRITQPTHKYQFIIFIFVSSMYSINHNHIYNHSILKQHINMYIWF